MAGPTFLRGPSMPGRTIQRDPNVDPVTGLYIPRTDFSEAGGDPVQRDRAGIPISSRAPAPDMSGAPKFYGKRPVARTQEEYEQLKAAGANPLEPNFVPHNIYKPGTPEWYAEQDQIDAFNTEGEGLAGLQDWEQKYLPGISEAVNAAIAGDEAAMARVNELMGSIKDPEIAAFVGDYVSQAASAGPGQEAIDRQIGQFDKLNALSDPSITAEEKLMMEVARREQEQDLRAQREAMAQNMRARGVYGSGAELTQNMMAQAEGSNRRALEYMSAQANAQQRAMDALGKASEMSSDIRKSEAQESQFRGTAADRAKEFNNRLRQEYETWKTETLDKRNQNKISNEQNWANIQSAINSNRVNHSQVMPNMDLKKLGVKHGIMAEGDKAVGDARTKVANALLFKEGKEKYGF